MTSASSFVVILVLTVVNAQAAGTSEQQPAHVLPTERVEAITLVRATDGQAVIRAATGPLTKIAAGDRLGVTKAVVTEIAGGRLVLEETFIDKDDRPNRARIVIIEGERGGTRYLQRSGERPITGSRPLIVMPAAPEPARPATKKPPPM
jgi:hypothetical protein